jgi:SAM-dependent methyltransferase
MSKLRIATHIEVEWLDQLSGSVTCPNCGAVGPVQQVLDIDYKPPDAQHRYVLQICPQCSVRFVDNTETMDYSTDELIEIGWNIYQVQLGAGVWPISAPLTRIEKPAGARVLEIGGAYGFGLDFCIRARGWRGVGYDPSPLAAFGARGLGLDIRQEYFEDKDIAAGPWDVVISTEVIEHLTHPPEFFALMRRALAPDGLLVLTTPDAEWITPELSPGALMPLLSPGAHVVLQTAASLETGLQAAGFAHVVVKREAMSLIAYASAAPFTLNEDPAPARAMYRRYLVERAKLTEPMSDLRLGFAGRGLFEAANDGDGQAVEVAWAALLPAVKARFGIDLEALAPLPAGAAEASLAELARMIPLGLGMILFGRVMYLISAGADRTKLEPMLRLAGEAIDALQGALGRRSLTDGLSASIRNIVEVEILLCQAEAANPDCVAPLVALGDTVAAWRGFVALVNAEALELAAELKAAVLSDMPDAGLAAGLRKDALLSLANFVLAPGRETAKTFDYARALRAMGADAEGDRVILAAFTRLVNESRAEEAERLQGEDPCFAALDSLAGKTADDARIASVILDLQRGRTEAALQRIAVLGNAGADPAVLGRLTVDGFVRLVNEGNFAAAAGVAQGRAIERRLADCPAELRHDALAALLILELQPGSVSSHIPQRLDEAMQGGLEEKRVNGLAMVSFVTLVNRGEPSIARLIWPLVEPLLIKLRPPYDDAACNTLFAAGLLFLQEKDDLRRAAAILARLRDGLVKRAPPGGAADPLLWPAMRGEVLALQKLKRGGEAILILREFTSLYAGAPEDLLQQIESQSA